MDYMPDKDKLRQIMKSDLPPDERERLNDPQEAAAFEVAVELEYQRCKRAAEQVAEWEKSVRDNPPKRVI